MAGNGPVEVVILDPSGAHKQLPVNTTPIGPGRARVNYVAKEPGLHSVNVFFAGQPIPNSPFGVRVSPSKFLAIDKKIFYYFLLFYCLFLDIIKRRESNFNKISPPFLYSFLKNFH